MSAYSTSAVRFPLQKAGERVCKQNRTCVDLAVTPNPSGTSAMLYTTTPEYAGVSSVIRPNPDFCTWLPYKKLISDDGFNQICVVLGIGRKVGSGESARQRALRALHKYPPHTAQCALFRFVSPRFCCPRNRSNF